eukprot:TRINITY_DN840_c0_g1_i2.p1 TRINITY_DN840_c0_g1~~TRINITY_DN840_c0_g1_i2.p1  ORF type:complete len:230 (+),score=52.03 TRINITY_DN840_c0_g1_i2:117-806(+)
MRTAIWNAQTSKLPTKSQSLIHIARSRRTALLSDVAGLTHKKNWKERSQWGSVFSYSIGEEKDGSGKGFLCHSSQRLNADNANEWKRLYPIGKQLKIKKGAKIQTEHHCNGHCLAPQVPNGNNDYGQWCLYISREAGRELKYWDDIAQGISNGKVHKVGCQRFNQNYRTAKSWNGVNVERFASLDWTIPNEAYLQGGKRYFYVYVWSILSKGENEQVNRFTTCGDLYIN